LGSATTAGSAPTNFSSGERTVLGRDDLDWHYSNPNFKGEYSPSLLEWLAREADQLLADARARAGRKAWAADVGYFTLESALCTYKSWHRPNRRYPNVYADMMVERIQIAEEHWAEPLDIFWRIRRESLPPVLRLEDNPNDPGVAPEKQNRYRETGEVVCMDIDWPCFASEFNDALHGYTTRAPSGSK
jgi:hypothetical protein